MPREASQASMAERLRILAMYAGERACVLRSAEVALVVGTILALINHYQAILSGTVGTFELLQIVVTYLLPYSVTTYGAASQGLRSELKKDVGRELSVGSRSR